MFSKLAGAGVSVFSYDAHGHGKSEPQGKQARAYVNAFSDLVIAPCWRSTHIARGIDGLADEHDAGSSRCNSRMALPSCGQAPPMRHPQFGMGLETRAGLSAAAFLPLNATGWQRLGPLELQASCAKTIGSWRLEG